MFFGEMKELGGISSIRPNRNTNKAFCFLGGVIIKSLRANVIYSFINYTHMSISSLFNFKSSKKSILDQFLIVKIMMWNKQENLQKLGQQQQGAVSKIVHTGSI